ncbi:MAG: cysteine dioxygenase family protein [Candidatus Baltobacteraceae bacterium]
MTSTLDAMLAHSMQDDRLVDAMQAGIAAFTRYRDEIPLLELSYTRMLLRKTHDYELVAMQWAPGAISPIHDHGKSRCWVVVLEGTLEVESYDRLDDGTGEIASLGAPCSATLKTDELDHRLNWRELHRVRNTQRVSSYSLQVYASPQFDYVVIDDVTFHCMRALPKYDATFAL